MKNHNYNNFKEIVINPTKAKVLYNEKNYKTE